MAITITNTEAEAIYELASYAYIKSSTKAARAKRFGLAYKDDYKELYLYYFVVSQWRQSRFVSEGYGNVISKEDLLIIQTRINELGYFLCGESRSYVPAPAPDPDPDPPQLRAIYYGWSDTNQLPTIEQIMDSLSINISAGSNYTIPFQQVQDWKYLWFWEPETEPIKTDWEQPGNALNKGQIGGSDNLFKSPKTIGNGRFFITSYQTIIDADSVGLLFKSGGIVIPDEEEPEEWTTATPPIVIGNDTTNVLEATHATLSSEIVVSINNGAYVPYAGSILVGDIDREVGYWKFKIRENVQELRHESSVVESPAFNKVPVTEQFTLTINLEGTTGATIYVNGSAITGNTITVNAGTILNNIVVVKAGFTITPSSVPTVLMDSNKSITFTAVPVPVYRTLTIVVNGLNDTYKIVIDGVEQESNTLTFIDGTILDDIHVEAENFTFTPPLVDTITMNQNRTLVFNATPVPRTLTIDTGDVEDVDIYINNVLHTGPLTFGHGTVLTNVRPQKAGYRFDPVSIPTVTMNGDQTIEFVGTEIPQYTLGINVTGPTVYTLRINGVVRTGTEFIYDEDTVIEEITITATGWTFSPVRLENIIMDQDREVSFEGTAIPQYTLTFDVDGTTDYTVKINGVVQPSGPLTYYAGTILNNIVLEKDGWAFTPASVATLTMNENKVLEFSASEVVNGNYLPGFTPYEPDERYARADQGGSASLVEVSPGVHKITVHRLDFISYIRVPVGGEIAIKEMDNESTLLHFNPALPWPNDENKNDYYITGYSAGSTGKFGFYGDGVKNKLEIRHWSNDTIYPPVPGIPSGSWLLYRRTERHKLDIFYTFGFEEVHLYTIDMTTAGPGGNDFMYLKHTIWDEDHINYPQYRGCFHELNDTWPPMLIENDDTDTISASHHILGPSEILVSENDGPWVQYAGPYSVGNTSKPAGYWKFKIKAAQGRPESVVVHSSPFTAIPFTEGVTDLLFTELQNVAYNASTKAYSRILSNEAGYGVNAENFLPVNGSAAIYFDTSVENIWVGFHTSDANTFRGDMEIAITIASGSREIYYTYKGGPSISTLPPVTAGNDYRLVCRQIGGVRVWKIERSSDDWVTYVDLYTFPIQSNTVKLYPLLFIPDGVTATGSNFKYEVYADQNVPEMDIVTPDPPTNGIVDNELDTFDWTNSPGYSNTTDYQVTTNGGGTWTDLPSKPFYVGNVNLAIGMVGVRVKSALGRNHSSAIYNAEPFTQAVNTTPEPPTLTADDTANTLSASHVLGDSEILVSVNNGAYAGYSGTISVGDVDRSAGYWKFKIRSAAGRNESSVVNSPAFTKLPVNQVVLTVNVTGASSYTVHVNGNPIVGNTLSVDEGTVLQNISVVAPGYSIDPESVASITMDENKTLEFTAVEIPSINYLPGFVPVILMPTYTNIISNTGGVWSRISNSQAASFTLPYPMEVGMEFALKVSELSYSLIGTADEVHSLWIDSDSGISVNTDGYPNLMSGPDAIGKFIIFQRDSLTSIKVFSSDGVNRTELYTFGTASSPSLTFGGKIDNANGTVDYPQMYGIEEPVDPEDPEETGGKANLKFSALTNLVYDEPTNTYTKINPAEVGYGHTSGRELPVNASGAYYFCEDCPDLYIGFHHTNMNVYRFDSVINVQLLEYNLEMAIRDGENTEYIRRDNDTNTEYRLICRMEGGTRVWKVEGSGDDWITFQVLYTFVNIEANDTSLYPVLYVGSEPNSIAEALKCEINLTGNI